MDTQHKTEDERFYRFTIDVNIEGDIVTAREEATAAIEVVVQLLNQQHETHVISFDFAEIVGESWYSVDNTEYTGKVTGDES